MLARRSIAITAVATALFWAGPAAQQPFPSDDEIREIARRGVPVAGKGGLVIGLLDASGSRRVVPVADVPYDARTIFEIGSITKAFTGVLLAEMVERSEVRLEDPVQDLLPKGIPVPSRNGRQIRLVDLATHTSALPRLPGNMAPADAANPYADYTVDRLHDFLRGHQLSRDIGERAEYSNLGAGLLGHALSLRAGRSYEALVTERILAPPGFHVLPLILAVLLVAGTFVAWRRTGASAFAILGHIVVFRRLRMAGSAGD